MVRCTANEAAAHRTIGSPFDFELELEVHDIAKFVLVLQHLHNNSFQYLSCPFGQASR